MLGPCISVRRYDGHVEDGFWNLLPPPILGPLSGPLPGIIAMITNGPVIIAMIPESGP